MGIFTQSLFFFCLLFLRKNYNVFHVSNYPSSLWTINKAQLFDRTENAYLAILYFLEVAQVESKNDLESFSFCPNCT